MRKTIPALALTLIISMLMAIVPARADNFYEEDEPFSQVSQMSSGGGTVSAMSLSEGQKNIVKRARQMLEVKWTPLRDIWQWGYEGTYRAGTTYTGVPYGQPVSAGYVGYAVTLTGFVGAVNNASSEFYTSYSYYNKIAPYYSSDCSGFVSYAWGLDVRASSSAIPGYAVGVGQSIYSIQVGDCLSMSSHAELVTDVKYDSAGNIVSISVSEQNPPLPYTTVYGQGGSQSLASLQAHINSGGYYIYRYTQRDSVTYTHDCAVPIDGDYCANCKTTAPKAKTTNGENCKIVTLYSDIVNVQIYYTLDGSDPNINGILYTEPIMLYSTTTVKAVAVSDTFEKGSVLIYTVELGAASAPTAVITSGYYEDNTIELGGRVRLATTTPDSVIYYSLDGSVPDTGSAVYGGEIVIDEDVTIKAFAVSEGMLDSPVSSFSYNTAAVSYVLAEPGAGGNISPEGIMQLFSGNDLRLTVTPDSGFAIADVAVDGESVGAVSEYTFSKITGNHVVTAAFLDTTQLPFTDVGEGDWFSQAVKYAYRSGLFDGTSATTFSPSGTMTRAMFITVLGRLANEVDGSAAQIGIVTGNNVRVRAQDNTSSAILGECSKFDVVEVLTAFGQWYKIVYNETIGYINSDYLAVYSEQLTDLASGQYYTAYVQWAYMTGILNGIADTNFNADSDITREEMALAIYNYMQVYGVILEQRADTILFADDAAISAAAKNAVYALQQANVISGMDNNSYQPKTNAARAHVAQIFKNFSEAIIS